MASILLIIMITVTGIKSCDTCRKALVWLSKEGLEHEFHDLRVSRLEENLIRRWVALAGWETLLNRRSTTWRALPANNKLAVDEDSAVLLMLKHPTLIKRPVFEAGPDLYVGFSDTIRQQLKSET